MKVFIGKIIEASADDIAKWLSAGDAANISSKGERAVRVLVSDPKHLLNAPPYLVAKLKMMLGDFNAKTHRWRNNE